MKRFFKVSLALLCMMLLAGGAFAMQLYSAVRVPEILRRYSSFVQSENGEWTVHDQYAAQLIRQTSEDELEKYARDGVVLLYPSLRGNELLGLVEPVLNVFLVCEDEMNADCVSIAVRGEAWHFAAEPETSEYDDFFCAHFTLPLDAGGLELLALMAENPYSLRVYSGDTYITSNVGTEENLKGKQNFEAQWRRTLASFTSLCGELGLDQYPLWDLNEAHWPENRPECARLMEPAQNESIPMDEAFFVADVSNSKGVLALQELLASAGFYSGKTDGDYGAQTRIAVRDAQRYFGLPQTGQADSALVGLLTNPETKKHATIAEEGMDAIRPGSIYLFEGSAEITFERIWIAPGIAPSSGVPGELIRPKNTSNCLLIADGSITNTSGRRLNLALEFNMGFETGENFYTGTLRCEQTQDTLFGFEMLPMENARIVAYAEIPQETIAALERGGARVQLSGGRN